VEPTDTHRKQKQTNGGTDRNFRIPCNCNSTYRLSIFVTEKLNDIKGVIRGRNSKGRQYNRQKKKDKGQTIILKTLQKTKD
jgi:hypothetical protein